MAASRGKGSREAHEGINPWLHCAIKKRLREVFKSRA